MIGYITLGSNDLSATMAFFDPILKPLGGKRAYTLDHKVAYGSGPKRPMPTLTCPHDMVQKKAQVDQVHAATGFMAVISATRTGTSSTSS